MGVEYRHHVIPRDTSFRPTVEQVLAFARAAAAEGWIPDALPEVHAAGGSEETALTARVLEGDAVKVAWPVDDRGATYPLTEGIGEDAYWSIELHWVRDLAPIGGEQVQTDFDVTCACGAELGGEREAPFYHLIAARCASCGRAFDGAAHPSTVEDPWTEETTELPGGAYYHFALVIDCGKAVPPASPRVQPALLRLWKEHLGVDFHEVGEIY